MHGEGYLDPVEQPDDLSSQNVSCCSHRAAQLCHAFSQKCRSEKTVNLNVSPCLMARRNLPSSGKGPMFMLAGEFGCEIELGCLDLDLGLGWGSRGGATEEVATTGRRRHQEHGQSESGMPDVGRHHSSI